MSNPFDASPEKSPPPYTGGELTPEAKQMAMLSHLLGALFGFLVPLIIWLLQKEKHSFVDDQGKEALNFQLTVLIAYVATTAIGVVLSCVTFGLSSLLPLVVWVAQLVLGIIACTKANAGEAYRYPINIRFIQ